jgi:hypothetical protein
MEKHAYPIFVLRNILTLTTVVRPPGTGAPVASVTLKVIGAAGMPAPMLLFKEVDKTLTAAGSPRPVTFRKETKSLTISEHDISSLTGKGDGRDVRVLHHEHSPFERAITVDGPKRGYCDEFIKDAESSQLNPPMLLVLLHRSRNRSTKHLDPEELLLHMIPPPVREDMTRPTTVKYFGTPVKIVTGMATET